MKNVVLIYFLKVYRPGIYNLQLITTQIKKPGMFNGTYQASEMYLVEELVVILNK